MPISTFCQTVPANASNITCNIPPPSHEECSQIPICNEHDHLSNIAIGSVCSTSFQVSACLSGFMYVNPINISAKPPYPFNNNQLWNITKNGTCYQRYYPYTRACCPGYYCPADMYCMLQCTQKGSYCPSADTATYPNCNQAYVDASSPGQVSQYQAWMGCGGSYVDDSMCPPGSYCTNTTEKAECPQGYSCRAGSSEPFKCSPLHGCPPGSHSPQNDTFWAGAVFGDILIVVFILMFYDTLKAYASTMFNKVYQKWTGKDFEQVRAERNQRKKKNLSTLFSKDIDKPRRKLLDNELQVQGDDNTYTALSYAASAAPWSDDSDAECGDDEKSSEPQKLAFFMDVEFRNLSLHLKSNNKTILDDCSGRLHCGTVNAVMGPSGAGKTSFLFTLCGKAAAYGKISGNIVINGERKNIHEFQDIVGFVPQSDAMTAEMTVKEMLSFNSKFRLSSKLSVDYRKSVVRDVLKLLKIGHIRHSLIGDDVKRGISGGQQKRVNIGMELVSQPSVLFCDEPTSGLDATTSNDVMEVLKLIADRGTLVLVVLHQPRYEIFSAFDNVILLADGGKMVYMGDTRKAMAYFEQFGYVKPDLVNPADFMMDIVSGTVDLAQKDEPDLVQKWKEMDTENKWTMHVNTEFSGNFMEEAYKDNAKYVARTRISFVKQIAMCTKRTVTITWRQKATLISDIIMITLIGFIIGYITDSDSFDKAASNLFNLIITSSIVGCIVSLRTFGNDRIMYWRFSSSGINRFSYYVGATIASSPWILFHPLIFIIFYWPMALPRGMFRYYFSMLVLGMFCAQGLGQFISVIVDPNKSILVSVVIVMIMNFLCGFEPTLSSFNSIMKFISNLSFARWQQEALWMKEINAWPAVFDAMKETQSEYYGYSVDDAVYHNNVVCMIVIGVVFRVMTYLALIFSNRAQQM